MPKFYYAWILERELWKTATVSTNLCPVISHNNFKLYGGSNSDKYAMLRQFVIFLHCCIEVAHKLLILFYNLHKTL